MNHAFNLETNSAYFGNLFKNVMTFKVSITSLLPSYSTNMKPALTLM